MRSRGWSIRAKIMTLAVVPLIAITGLAVFGVAATVGPALNLLETNKYDHAVTDRGERLMVELQRERRISGGFAPGSVELLDQRGKTNEAYTEFKARYAADNGAQDLPASSVRLVNRFMSAMDNLPQIRQDFDNGKTDANAAIGRYSEVIDLAYEMFAPLKHVADAGLSQVANGLFFISRTRELLAREDAIMTATIADGKITTVEHTRLMQAIGARRQMQDEALAALTSPNKEHYAAIFASDAYQTLYAIEEHFNNRRQPGPVDIDGQIWRSSADAVLSEMDRTEDAAAKAALELANEVGIAAFTRPIVAGMIGLLCAALALTLALRTGRSVVRRLERLRVSALSIANEQLPRAIATLREPGSPLTDPLLNDIPMVAVGSDEVGQVGHAFAAVQRTAIRAAVDEATLRRGISEVFLNIARRSQALLHRQLTLLDRMERRTTSPQELEDLFRLDHMATRMRRHAEALVILAGSAPGRGWRHPVPVIDVIRGATSEIEDYVRVSLDRLPDARIAGRAVGDLIHLLAELLENATSFAPPHTTVRVHAETVGNGLAIQIEDRGLGMSEAELAEANVRLAEPPAFDPSHSARLGLLVVARLAARQGITVRLRPSPYGGVTAVILVPEEMVMAGHGELPTKEITATGPKEISAQPFVEDRANQTTASLVDGLPRRVRRPVTAPPEPVPDPAETTVTLVEEANTINLTRSADEVRSRMSAFQSGTVRGRAQAGSIAQPGEQKSSGSAPDAAEEGSA